MDVVQDAKALSPTKLQVTLAKPSNDWLYRMTTRVGAMFSRTGVDKLATDPVGTGPYTLDEVEPRRLDRADPQRQLLRQEALLPDRDAEVLQGPHGAQQRAADRHHQRHRHGAGAGVARAVLQQQQVPGHRGHHQRRGGAVVQQRQGPAERRAGAPGGPVRASTTRRSWTPAGPAAASSSAAWSRRPTRGTRTSPACTRTTWPRPRRCWRQAGKTGVNLRLRLPTLPVRHVLRPGRQEPARAGRLQGHPRPARVPGRVADHRLQERRLRHVDRRARRTA